MISMIQFADRLVTYDVFLEDLSSKVAEKVIKQRNDPEFISQSKAFKMFGRKNVERWRKEGKVVPAKRPGKLEYCTAELRRLQCVKQDYFTCDDK